VTVNRIVEIEVLGGQTLLSVVLRDATQNGSLTSRCATDDLPPRLSRGDGNRLENHPARAIHRRLHKIAVTEVRLREDVRWQRYHAAVADLTDTNHSHVTPLV
jgi:hypothetical protein